MHEPEKILDYASPRSHGRVRLPAESHIEIQSDRDRTTIVETLKGRDTAIAAIGFAAFVLIVFLCAICVAAGDVYSHRDGNAGYLVLLIFLSALWLAEAVLGVLVLGQTYRGTTLRIVDGELTLKFRGLFSSDRAHRWPIEEIGELRVEMTQSGTDVTPLAELQIRPANDVSVHLFTDHHETEVRRIAAIMARALAGKHAAPMPDYPAANPDEANFNRLLQTTRALRGSEQAKRGS